MYLPSGHPRAFAHSPPVQSHSFPPDARPILPTNPTDDIIPHCSTKDDWYEGILFWFKICNYIAQHVCTVKHRVKCIYYCIVS